MHMYLYVVFSMSLGTCGVIHGASLDIGVNSTVIFTVSFKIAFLLLILFNRSKF